MFHYPFPNREWAAEFATQVRALHTYAKVRKIKGRWQVLTGKKVTLELEED